MFKPYHKSFLKVKIKSLAEESRIIRLEERKSYVNSQREQLYLHRVCDVREESRAAQIAYAYLRGRSLSSIESGAKPSWIRDRVYRRAHKIVQKFGLAKTHGDFQRWLQTTGVEQ